MDTQEIKLSAMQEKISDLENQLNSLKSGAKPPLPNYQIPDSNSKFLQMDLSNSPYFKVEQQMAEKKFLYNNVYSQPCDQEKELERKFKLEKFFKQQNDWWSDDLSQFNFGNRSVSREFEDASAKELIRKRCELLREQKSAGSVRSGQRSRHDSYSSLNNRVMSPSVKFEMGAVNSTPVKQL